MQDEWAEQETGTHQDHVIAHVIGATALGYFISDETAHILLDIGFIWTLYLDGEMGLVPQVMALAELDVDEETKASLREDVRQLQNSAGSESAPLSRLTQAPAGCLITEVSFQGRGHERRILIAGEESCIAVETSLETGQIQIHAA
ncbi:MAG: hypothetical protein H7Y30_11730 [Pyrinomonadaceae bacterium]|nr:hypothetical protein [Pyrinomonadaceae bacterium]